jgi:hypothetical protein
LFGEPLLVLQVEYHAKGSGFVSNHAYLNYPEDVDEKYWKDAEVQDLTEVSEK